MYLCVYGLEFCICEKQFNYFAQLFEFFSGPIFLFETDFTLERKIYMLKKREKDQFFMCGQVNGSCLSNPAFQYQRFKARLM